MQFSVDQLSHAICTDHLRAPETEKEIKEKKFHFNKMFIFMVVKSKVNSLVFKKIVSFAY